MKKHSESIAVLQKSVDELTKKYGAKLLFTGTVAILSDEHEVECMEILQFGIRAGLILLLNDSIEWTQNCDEDFIEGKPQTIN